MLHFHYLTYCFAKAKILKNFTNKKKSYLCLSYNHEKYEEISNHRIKHYPNDG